ncbi:MAG: DUF1588 domain-containing protein, partial [Myxococcales bacterium]
AQAERMLKDPRAEAAVLEFHHRLLDTRHYSALRRDPNRFPNYTATLGRSMQRETELFVREVVFGERAGLHRLLTAPYTYVNGELAKVYGLTGTFGAEFQRAELKPSERMGVLTQAGFLASHAYDVDPDPIHRGVFVNLNILCADLPSPPDNIPPLPAIAPAQTNRARVEAHTGKGTCGGACHGVLINPLGFAFEGYDSLGQVRTTDNGHPVDTSGEYPFEDGVRRFDNALQLAGFVANSKLAHRCYVKRWIEFTQGRRAAPQDEETVEALAQGSLREGLPTQALLTRIVGTRAFRMRAAEEANR